MKRIIYINWLFIYCLVNVSVASEIIENKTNIQNIRDVRREVHFTEIRNAKEEVQIIDLVAMNVLKNAINAVESSACSIDLNAMMNGLKTRIPWAISMYDSSVKAPSGIELGSIYQFGSFDECMGISTNDENVNIKPKYCLTDATLDGYSVRLEARRDFKDSYDYYDRYDDSRDLFERRYSGMGMRGGRDFLPPMGRRDPMRLSPPLGGSIGRSGGSSSMRSGMSSGNGGYDSVFSRRSPPPRSGNGMSRFSTYEDFSRDSFDDRRISRDSFDDRRPVMRGPSPTHRYATY